MHLFPANSPQFDLGALCGFVLRYSFLTLIFGSLATFLRKLFVSVVYQAASTDVRAYIHENFPHFNLPHWLVAILSVMSFMVLGVLVVWLSKP